MSYHRTIQRVNANSSYTLTASNGFSAVRDLSSLAIGQTIAGTVNLENMPGGYADGFNYQVRYAANDGSEATLIFNCQTGEVIASSWSPAN